MNASLNRKQYTYLIGVVWYSLALRLNFWRVILIYICELALLFAFGATSKGHHELRFFFEKKICLDGFAKKMWTYNTKSLWPNYTTTHNENHPNDQQQISTIRRFKCQDQERNLTRRPDKPIKCLNYLKIDVLFFVSKQRNKAAKRKFLAYRDAIVRYKSQSAAKSSRVESRSVGNRD